MSTFKDYLVSSFPLSKGKLDTLNKIFPHRNFIQVQNSPRETTICSYRVVIVSDKLIDNKLYLTTFSANYLCHSSLFHNEFTLLYYCNNKFYNVVLNEDSIADNLHELLSKDAYSHTLKIKKIELLFKVKVSEELLILI